MLDIVKNPGRVMAAEGSRELGKSMPGAGFPAWASRSEAILAMRCSANSWMKLTRWASEARRSGTYHGSRPAAAQHGRVAVGGSSKDSALEIQNTQLRT
jgi:hypothetical protein